MSWISIDPAGTHDVANVMISAGNATLGLLARIRSLADQGGLGDLRSSVAAEVSSAAATIERHTEAWLIQGNEAVRRAIQLVQDQRASAVVNAIPSGYAAAIIGGSAIVGGGGNSWYPASSGSNSVMTIGGGDSWSPTVSGTTFSSVTIGGGHSSRNTGNPILDMAALVQDRQESMRAKLAAASSARVVGSADPVAAAMASRAYSNVMAGMGLPGSLVSAPAGARIGSGGSASAGYSKLGTYGDVLIEVPD